MMTIDVLEKHLAYLMCKYDLELMCTVRYPEKSPPHIDLSTPQPDQHRTNMVANAIRYLEHRQLLQRRTDNPSLATILDDHQTTCN